MSNKVCVPNKTENVDLNVFNLITKKNELEHISCKFGSKKCNSNQIWNNDKCPRECKNPRQIVCEKDYIWNPTKCAFENGECLKSVADDLKIVGDEIIETTKSASTKIVPKKRISKNFNEKKLICKMKTYCILLVFLLIVVALLIVVSICCCIIK